MINYTKLIPWIIILGLIVFIGVTRSCQKETITVRVPAVVGSIPSAPITHLEPTGETFNVIWRDKTIERKEPINDSLFEAYRDLEQRYKADSLELERANMYIDAITLRQFTSDFEDENLKLTISGTVQGYLKEVSIPKYEIKERKIGIPKKRFHIGPFIGVDTRGQISGGIGVSYSVFSF